MSGIAAWGIVAMVADSHASGDWTILHLPDDAMG